MKTLKLPLLVCAALVFGVAATGFAQVDSSTATYYCSVDGEGPVALVDWRSRQATVRAVPLGEPFVFATVDAAGEALRVGTYFKQISKPNQDDRDAAQAVVDAERLAVKSHIVRNGNKPRGWTPGIPKVEGEVDEFGGRHATGWQCPECLGDVHVIVER